MSKSTIDNAFARDDIYDDNDADSMLLYNPSKSSKVKPVAKQSSSQNKSSMLKAVSVSAYRLVNGKYNDPVNLGLAIYGYLNTMDYKLLLYMNSDKQVAFAQINTQFNFIISQERYATFYDSTGCNWSVLFDKHESLLEFCRYICLAKYLSTNRSSVIALDATTGTGDNLECGNTIEIKFTGWIIPNSMDAIGTVFAQSINGKPCICTLGVNKMITCWEEAMLSMKKGGRRWFCVPPQKSGPVNRYPLDVAVISTAGATLLFDVEVTRLKKERTSSVRSTAAGIAALADDVSLSSSANFSSDQGTPTHKTKHPEKSEFINRMSKIGQSVLPPKPNSTAVRNKKQQRVTEERQMSVEEYDEDDEYDDDSSSMKDGEGDNLQRSGGGQKKLVAKTPLPTPVTYHNNNPTAVLMQQTPHQQGNMMMSGMSLPPNYQNLNTPGFQIIQQHPGIAGQLIPFQANSAEHYYQQQQQMGYNISVQPQAKINNDQHSQSPTLSEQKSSSDGVHSAMLVSETRQHNTEMRIAMSKMQDKVDKIYEKYLETQSMTLAVSNNSAPGSAFTMETNVVLTNLTRIIQENERLKKDLLEQQDKMAKQSEKISELLARNQELTEQHHMSIEKSTSSLQLTASQTQNKILELEQERLNITKELSDRIREITNLQMQMDGIQNECKEAKQKLGSVFTDLEQERATTLRLKTGIVEADQRVSQLDVQLKEEKQAHGLLQEKQKLTLEQLKTTQHRLQETEGVKEELLNKGKSDRNKLENELASVRQRYEKDLEDLQNTLRAERSSQYSDKSIELNKIEEELTRNWRDKCDRMVEAERQRMQRKVAEHEEERKKLEDDLAKMEDKMQDFKQKALAMRQRFKDEIDELKEKIEELTNQESEVEKEVINTEAKRIMSTLYHTLRKKIKNHKKYKGAKVCEVLLSNIKSVTLKLTREGSDDENGDEEQDEEDASMSSASEVEIERTAIGIQVEKRSHEVSVQCAGVVLTACAIQTDPEQRTVFSAGGHYVSNVEMGIQHDMVKTKASISQLSTVSPLINNNDGLQHSNEQISVLPSLDRGEKIVDTPNEGEPEFNDVNDAINKESMIPLIIKSEPDLPSSLEINADTGNVSSISEADLILENETNELFVTCVESKDDKLNTTMDVLHVNHENNTDEVRKTSFSSECSEEDGKIFAIVKELETGQTDSLIMESDTTILQEIGLNEGQESDDDICNEKDDANTLTKDSIVFINNGNSLIENDVASSQNDPASIQNDNTPIIDDNTSIQDSSASNQDSFASNHNVVDSVQDEVSKHTIVSENIEDNLGNLDCSEQPKLDSDFNNDGDFINEIKPVVENLSEELVEQILTEDTIINEDNLVDAKNVVIAENGGNIFPSDEVFNNANNDVDLQDTPTIDSTNSTVPLDSEKLVTQTLDTKKSSEIFTCAESTADVNEILASARNPADITSLHVDNVIPPVEVNKPPPLIFNDDDDDDADDFWNSMAVSTAPAPSSTKSTSVSSVGAANKGSKVTNTTTTVAKKSLVPVALDESGKQQPPPLFDADDDDDFDWLK